MDDISATQTDKAKITHVVAASVVFIANHSGGDQQQINISIALPEQDPQSNVGEMRCLVEIGNLVAPYYAYGIDALQALGLAFASMRREIKKLNDNGWEFYHPQEPSMPIAFDFLYCGDESANPWSLE